MAVHFHPVHVKEVRRETPDCVSVLLEIPDHLQQDFAFKQGQSLTLRTFINNQEIRRTYSICSSPLEKEWRVAIKKVEGGLFSSFANHELKKGDLLEIMQPVGRFYTELDPGHKKNYVAFAAGSGITPVLSLIKTTLATEPQSKFTLIYGNRSRGSIIFFEELEALKNRYIERFNLVHVLSREKTESPVNAGRIDQEKLESLGKLVDYNFTDDFFICGPEEMIFTVRDYLLGKGISQKKIHFELFTTPGQTAVRKTTSSGSRYEGSVSEVTIKLDGRTFDIEIPASSSQNILDAALQQGADLPYACKGGVCCTCKARLLEGKVEMDVHWGLEEEEVKQGFILTCQSHPASPRVVVDFDAK